MIPLGSSAGVLPRVATHGLTNPDFPLTIVKPPLLDLSSLTISSPVSNGTSVIRIVQSRIQRRNSSASSLQSHLRARKERKDFQPPRNPECCNVKRSEGLASTNCETKEPNFELGHEPRALSAKTVAPIKQDIIHKSESADCLHDSEVNDTISIKGPDPIVTNDDGIITKKHRNKTGTKSRKNRTKKQHKCGKSARKKNGKKASLKNNSVFEELSTQNARVQGMVATTENVRRSISSVLLSKSNGSILNISKLQATYMPSNRTRRNIICLPKVPIKSNSPQIKISKNSPRKSSSAAFPISNVLDNNMSPPRKVLGWSSQDDGRVTLRKVYLSEVQSRMLCGAPSAPPGTPTADQLERVQYIPSLLDIKGQRSVKAKLEKIELKIKIEEQKKLEKSMKEEQKKFTESIAQLKQRQREEIYALNKVMTRLENEKFEKFMKEKEAESLPV